MTTYLQTGVDGPVVRDDGAPVDDLELALELVEGARVLACVKGATSATYTTRQGAGQWTRGEDR